MRYCLNDCCVAQLTSAQPTSAQPTIDKIFQSGVGAACDVQSLRSSFGWWRFDSWVQGRDGLHLQERNRPDERGLRCGLWYRVGTVFALNRTTWSPRKFLIGRDRITHGFWRVVPTKWECKSNMRSISGVSSQYLNSDKLHCILFFTDTETYLLKKTLDLSSLGNISNFKT